MNGPLPHTAETRESRLQPFGFSYWIELNSPACTPGNQDPERYHTKSERPHTVFSSIGREITIWTAFEPFVYHFLLMLNETNAYSGKCDGCATEGVPIMKLSLGRDFFGRVYDRLSPNADSSPKWYCDICSVEKNLQRDFRDIQQEFRKLHKGDASVLTEPQELERAKLRLKEVAVIIAAAKRKHALLTTEEVAALADSLDAHQPTSRL